MEFTLDAFREQMSRLGSLQEIMSKIPGMEGVVNQIDGLDVEKRMNRMLGIVDSMTGDEKRNPIRVLDQGRRRRIAVGAGVELREVNELVKQFDAMSRVMKVKAGKGPQIGITLPGDRPERKRWR
jgi:signal recognition particle subunit SRP54